MPGFVDFLTGEGLSDDTIRMYLRHVAAAQRYLERRNTSLKDATPTDLRAWGDTLPHSHSTRGQAVAALNHYYRYKGVWHPPVKAIRVPSQPEMVCRTLEEDQARALTKMALDWPEEGPRLAVLFGLYLALRRTEIAKAEWSRFSPARDWYTVTGKRDKTATLPVHPVLRDALPESRSGFVFPGRKGVRDHVTPATIWTWTKRVAEAAGIDEFTTHRLRHTALTTANDNTGDLRAVQTFARHEKPETTAGYTRTKTDSLRRVSDALDYL